MSDLNALNISDHDPEQHDGQDWFAAHDVDLTCPACLGNEHDCDDCDGSGRLAIIWNTIWNTGFYSIPGEVKAPAVHGPIVAFEYNDSIWFGMTGCGMDMSPYLIAAWFHFFPTVRWIPDGWINETKLFGGYYGSVAGQEIEDKIFPILKGQLENEIAKKQASLKRLNDHLKTNRQTKRPGGKK